MEKKKNHQTQTRSHFAMSNRNFNKENQGTRKHLKIAQRFVLKSPIPVGAFYKAYKGIDLSTRKYVTIYIKPSSKERLFSKGIKEELRQKIAPPIKWTGTQKIDKNIFDIQVHARYGPSLHEIMIRYKQKISEKTFYLLAYHLLKLIDRIDNSGFVLRSLSLKNIILSQSYHKNDLYLINIFDLERRNQECFSIYDVKYCSVGTHLKLKTSSKDTLQSICYLLMDFYKKGNLFVSMKNKQQKDYLEFKTTLKPEGIPILFLQFFEYVRNLNHIQQIKFTQWKIKFKKFVSEEEFHKPYEWVTAAKLKSGSTSQSKDSRAAASNMFSRDPQEIASVEELDDEPAYNYILNQQDQNIVYLEQDEDISEFEEGDTSDLQKVSDKLLETFTFSVKKY